jgi:predicted nucleic acid-binding protein
VIVVDASVMVELLLRTPVGLRAQGFVLDVEPPHAPHLLDVEVAQVLRRLASRRTLSATRGAEAIADLVAMPMVRHDHVPLLGRAWALRENVSAYDAVYVALAEALDARLLTCDARLAQQPGMRRRALLVA